MLTVMQSQAFSTCSASSRTRSGSSRCAWRMWPGAPEYDDGMPYPIHIGHRSQQQAALGRKKRFVRYRFSLIATTKCAKRWPPGGERDPQASSLSFVWTGHREADDLHTEPWVGSGCCGVATVAQAAGPDLISSDCPRVRYKEACFMEHLLGTSTTRKTENTQEGLAMASALGRAAMVGIKGIPATGASRRMAASGAARRGFKTNPHVEVNEENCLDFHAMYTRRHRLQQWCFNLFLELYS